jgi:hypothetical protein
MRPPENNFGNMPPERPKGASKREWKDYLRKSIERVPNDIRKKIQAQYGKEDGGVGTNGNPEEVWVATVRTSEGPYSVVDETELE